MLYSVKPIFKQLDTFLMCIPIAPITAEFMFSLVHLSANRQFTIRTFCFEGPRNLFQHLVQLVRYIYVSASCHHTCRHNLICLFYLFVVTNYTAFIKLVIHAC